MPASRTNGRLCLMGRVLLLTLLIGGHLPFAAAAQEEPESPPASELPWSRPADQDGVVGPRELLELYGITAGELARIRDDGRLIPEEEPLLLQILYRLGRLPVAETAAWPKVDADWDRVLARPREFRVLAFQLRGAVTQVTRHDVLPALRESLEFSEYFSVELQIADGPEISVYALQLPEAWKSGEALTATGGCDALLIEAGKVVDQWPRLVFATARMAWYPDKVMPGLGITEGHRRLAQLGVDIGLFDNLQASHAKELSADDQQLFYQILAATRKHNTLAVAADEARALDLGQYLLAPIEYQGMLTRFEADVRRVTRIAVSEPALQRLLGADHYYELDVTIPLGNQPIRLKGRDEKSSPAYTQKYPATCCVTHIPEELQQQVSERRDQQSGALINQRVWIGAYFFKVWAYQSDYVMAYDPDQFHLSPLFIGSSVTLVEEPVPSRSQASGYVFAAIFLVCLAAIWISVWRTSARPRRGNDK